MDRISQVGGMSGGDLVSPSQSMVSADFRSSFLLREKQGN